MHNTVVHFYLKVSEKTNELSLRYLTTEGLKNGQNHRWTDRTKDKGNYYGHQLITQECNQWKVKSIFLGIPPELFICSDVVMKK